GPYSSYRHYRQKLLGQRSAGGEPGKQKATEVKRTFDRRGREPRLAAASASFYHVTHGYGSLAPSQRVTRSIEFLRLRLGSRSNGRTQAKAGHILCLRATRRNFCGNKSQIWRTSKRSC